MKSILLAVLCVVALAAAKKIKPVANNVGGCPYAHLHPAASEVHMTPAEAQYQLCKQQCLLTHQQQQIALTTEQKVEQLKRELAEAEAFLGSISPKQTPNEASANEQPARGQQSPSAEQQPHKDSDAPANTRRKADKQKAKPCRVPTENAFLANVPLNRNGKRKKRKRRSFRQQTFVEEGESDTDSEDFLACLNEIDDLFFERPGLEKPFRRPNCVHFLPGFSDSVLKAKPQERSVNIAETQKSLVNFYGVYSLQSSYQSPYDNALQGQENLGLTLSNAPIDDDLPNIAPANALSMSTFPKSAPEFSQNSLHVELLSFYSYALLPIVFFQAGIVLWLYVF